MTAKITIRIPDTEHEKLKEAARRAKRSINQQVLVYIDEGMKAEAENERAG